MKLSYYLDRYLRERPFFLALARAKEAWLLQGYKPLDQPILDLGCGDGFFAHIADLGAKWGVDMAGSRMGEVPSGTYKKLIIYDGEKLPLPDNSVGTVVANSVLEHVENLPAVLFEIYRVLKPDGRLIAPVMAKPWEENLLGGKIFGDGYRKWWRKIQEHRNLLTAEGWRKAFRQAGFMPRTEVGHFNRRMCRYIEIGHYLSVPYLISYKLSKKWTVVRFNPFPTGLLRKLMEKNLPADEAGAIFFIWEKPKPNSGRRRGGRGGRFPADRW